MPPVQDQIKEINDSVSRINEGLSDTNIKPLPALTPDNIQEDVPVIEIPEVPVDQTIEGDLVDFAGDAQYGMDQLSAEQAKRRDEAGQAKDQSLESLLSELESQESLGTLQLKAEDKFNVAPLEQSLNKINNQILQEQTKLRRIKERVTEEGGGLKMGAAAEIRNAEDQSYRRQADLALQKLAIQGDYSVAVDRADRYAQAMYDRQKLQLDVRKFVFDELKDQFNTEDQRAFQIAYDNQNRKIEQERADFVSLQNAKIEAIKMAQMNNAPQSVIDAIGNAQTPEDVLRTAGQYGSVDMLQRQIQNQTLANAVKAGRVKDYELAQLSAAEERRNNAIEIGQLLPEQFEVVDKYDADFRSEPIVKEFNEAAGARFAFENVVKNGVKGVQDLQLVYNFMKSVDPESVVRESEFAMAAETGNIFAGKFTKFNEGYFGAGGFLPPEVQQSFMNAANSAWDGKQTQYYNVKEQFGEKINRQLGINNGSTYLTSYEDGAPLPMASSIESAKVNEVIVKDGIKYRKQADGTFVQITD